MRKLVIATLAATLGLAPLAAAAQDVPSYAQDGGGGDQQIRGRITAFDGGYNLQVQDDQGYSDNVQLHQGTIINPTGLTLAPGMVVSILGYNQGSSFAANEVDTPYTIDAGVPYYDSQPWTYYGGGVSLGFFFGSLGWWHGSYFQNAPYAYQGGYRVYNSVNFTNIYHNGSFQGRSYIAPAWRGGYVPHGGNGGNYHPGGPNRSGYNPGGPMIPNHNPGGPQLPGGQGGYRSGATGNGPTFPGGQGGYRSGATTGSRPTFPGGQGGYRSGATTTTRQTFPGGQGGYRSGAAVPRPAAPGGQGGFHGAAAPHGAPAGGGHAGGGGGAHGGGGGAHH